MSDLCFRCEIGRLVEGGGVKGATVVLVAGKGKRVK